MCNEGPSADCKTDVFPYLWRSAHACHEAGFAPAATTVVNSVYLVAISLLCPHTLLSLETISSSQLGCLLWGGEMRGKAQRQTPLKKMEGREMVFLQLSTHLMYTSTSHKRILFFLFCVSVTHLPFCLLEFHRNLFEQKYVILYLPQPLLSYLLFLFSLAASLSCPPNKPVLD